jgi:hypothetical protein
MILAHSLLGGDVAEHVILLLIGSSHALLDVPCADLLQDFRFFPQPASFMGWGCSECGWLFKPPGGPVGKSLDEMTRAFVSRRDKEFAAHSCVEHSKQQQVKPIKP